MPIVNINLPLNTPGGWLDTGIVLLSTVNVYFVPTGQGTFDPLVQEYAYPEGRYPGDVTGGHAVLPLLVSTDFTFGGDPSSWLAINPQYPTAPVNPNDVVPLCLVGVVRTNGSGPPSSQATNAFRLNRGGSTQTIGPGRLYLAFNDQSGAQLDNTGSFDVVITYPPDVPTIVATPSLSGSIPLITITGQ